MIRVTDLYCYPIKSCAPIPLDSAHVGRIGFDHDRELMLIDAEGQFLTLRTHQTLWRVQPAIADDQLEIAAPEMPSLRFVPLHTGPAVESGIWSDRVQVVVQDDEVNQWFSRYLDQDVQLVALHQDHPRSVDPKFATDPGDIVSLADGYPLLLISQASLEGLNERLDMPVGMRRFRPNIVVEGCEPYAEDSWREVRIGDMSLFGVKLCARCEVLLTDPETLERSTDVVKTLQQYRRQNSGVMFGMNMIPRGTGRIALGDEVAVC